MPPAHLANTTNLTHHHPVGAGHARPAALRQKCCDGKAEGGTCPAPTIATRGRTELCRNRTYLLSRTIFPFRTSTLFMFVDTGPFPLPLETINYLTGNLSGCNGLSGLAQFRTFIFISLSGTPGFLCGNNKDQVLILGRNSSRTYQHPFQLPVN